MKTNRPVPTELWSTIEASVEKASRFEFKRPIGLNLAVGLAVFAILSFVYTAQFSGTFQHNDVNAYLYELHMEMYPDTKEEKTADIFDLI